MTGELRGGRAGVAKSLQRFRKHRFCTKAANQWWTPEVGKQLQGLQNLARQEGAQVLCASGDATRP
eukprot:2102629-Prorocentrum_lima.AAC.1